MRTLCHEAKCVIEEVLSLRDFATRLGSGDGEYLSQARDKRERQNVKEVRR